MQAKRTALSLLLLCVGSQLTAMGGAADWWKADTNRLPSIASVFGTGADSERAVTAGKFSIDTNGVLTASKDGLTLEGRTAYAGDQELRARVRLHTDLTPAPYALLYLGKGDTNAPAFYLHLGGAKPAQRVDCSPYRGVAGKQNLPLNDLAALTEKLDWPSPAVNYFAYNLRAYNA